MAKYNPFLISNSSLCPTISSLQAKLYSLFLAPLSLCMRKHKHNETAAQMQLSIFSYSLQTSHRPMFLVPTELRSRHTF